MKFKEDIQPISYVKANATEILAQINETHKPLYVTQNGRTRAVIIDPESFENMQKLISMLKLITLGEKDYQDGKTIEQKTLFSEIEEHFGWNK